MSSNLDLDMTIMSAGVKAGMWDALVAGVKKTKKDAAAAGVPPEPFYAALVEEMVFNIWPDVEKGACKRSKKALNH